MRPPILQWKVAFALIAVVVAAAALGSALHSTEAQTNGTRIGGWTGYTPAPTTTHTGTVVLLPGAGKMAPQKRREECVSLKAMVSQSPKAVRRDLERSIRSVCRKRR